MKNSFSCQREKGREQMARMSREKSRTREEIEHEDGDEGRGRSRGTDGDSQGTSSGDYSALRRGRTEEAGPARGESSRSLPGAQAALKQRSIETVRRRSAVRNNPHHSATKG